MKEKAGRLWAQAEPYATRLSVNAAKVGYLVLRSKLNSLLVHCLAQSSSSTLPLTLPCFCDGMSSDRDENVVPQSKAGERMVQFSGDQDTGFG